MTSGAGKRRAERGLPPRKEGMRGRSRYVFSDKRQRFHNATPQARAALLDGPPRLVAEDKNRVAIVFSVSRDWLRPRCESIRELWPLIQELRLPECEPYPLPPWGRPFLGGPSIRVTSRPAARFTKRIDTLDSVPLMNSHKPCEPPR
jgi:hypothetical protein